MAKEGWRAAPGWFDRGDSTTQIGALYLWTRDTGDQAWFRQLNQALRNDDADALKWLQPLIEAMRAGLDKLPPFEGTVYRAVSVFGDRSF